MLNGPVRVRQPWQSLIAFHRVSTRANARTPLAPDHAAQQVRKWLAAPAAGVPAETPDPVAVLGRLLATHQVDGRLIHNAHLAAPAICHGVEVCSADAGFARVPAVQWRNPRDERAG